MPDFDFSSLITDRGQADVDNLRSLLSTPLSDWTAEQLAAFNQAISKGAYNYTDLNRVTACMDYLNEQLRGYGYQTGYSKFTIPHKAVSALPDGYTELAYIQSSGTQYIDTGFKPNNNTRAVADFEFTATNTWRAVFAARDANSANSFSLEYIGGAFRSDYGSDTSQQFPMGALGRRIYDKDRETTTIDGTSQSYANTPFQCGHNLCLWALNDNGGIKWLASGKLYSCQIYDNGTLVRDYVPCRSPDGEVGLYDLVNDAFYGNAGTGDFIAGPEPVALPDGYTQVEYIQSSGTQYIDTDFKPDQDTKIIVDAEITSEVLYGSIFGSRNSSSSGQFNLWPASSQQWRYDYGTSAYLMVSASSTGRHIFTADGPDVSIDDQSQAYGQQTFQTNNNLYLLTINLGSSTGEKCRGKLYSCQIYDNGALIRDFVPCKNPSGAAGLYDRIGNQFYGNAGSGSFTAGPEVEAPDGPGEELDPYTWYESDVPTASLMGAYLDNVEALRSTLEVLSTTPETPESMAALTYEEANDIERILLAVDALITNMINAYFYSNEINCGEV